MMFDWTAINVLKYEWIVKSEAQKQDINDEANEGVKQVLADLNEQYEELVEAFIDSVFEFEAKLERTEWEKIVAEKQFYIFYPSDVRIMLGGVVKRYEEAIEKAATERQNVINAAVP